MISHSTANTMNVAVPAHTAATVPTTTEKISAAHAGDGQTEQTQADFRGEVCDRDQPLLVVQAENRSMQAHRRDHEGGRADRQHHRRQVQVLLFGGDRF